MAISQFLSWLFWTAIILIFVFSLVIIFVYLLRRGLGKFQVRMGPNRAGPWGIIQPLADGVKLFLKEDIVPMAVDKPVHFLAPLIFFLPVIPIFAVIPFKDKGGLVPELNIGILYILALSSLASLGIIMAGWGSNNKFSLLGAMRAIVQMVSYELPLVTSIAGVILLSNSLSLNQIVKSQSLPFLLIQPLGFLVYFISALSELNRTPFDLVEADSEIVAGYHTEYSGIKFAMFYVGEFTYLTAVSALGPILFWGGWRGPLLPPPFWFVLKVFIFFFLVLWVWGTLPRLRVDQLMDFAWKALFPWSLINLFLVGLESVFLPELSWAVILINLAVTVLVVLSWSKLFKLGGGRVAVRAFWSGYS